MLGLLKRRSSSGFSPSSTAEEVTAGIDGSGLVAIVTGASHGIGAETCRVLALRGAHVVMSVRNLLSGASVREDILRKVPTAKVEVMEIDLSSMSYVRKFVVNFNALNLQLNILIYNRFSAHGQSKLANILHSSELSNHMKGAATVCYLALHPRVAGVTGKYFIDFDDVGLKYPATDKELAKRLWDFSGSLIP
ncbi:hypothetical protein C2845_PM16G02360 [Panicum miliaceum]|uniref:Short-chain dehydrogenase TIC 32, chloroplastic-like n=1 Tax=Panicum miliaceum TaxID=4540 RepID=A0A3L6Q0Y7_PANMI|nr:hypothetical protein C2845_PM16G02360 [Panicum miliaceum]